jgi:cellobiose phosphorylase
VATFGRFDDARCEYVITRPDTPLPWINYLGAESQFGIITNTGGGYAFNRDARLRRLTRYRYNAPRDAGGRQLYVRDDADGSYWSPTWQPAGVDLDGYECRHGLGVTTITGRRDGIVAEVTFVVPLGSDAELWRVRLRNERDTPAALSLFGAVEFCLWDALDDATNLQRNLSIGEVEVHDGVILHTTEHRERRDHVAWFACSDAVAYDTDRDSFLGPYRGWDRPVAVERGQTSGTIAHGWSPIGAHQARVELAAGETREITFGLGYWEGPGEPAAALPAVERCMALDVDAELDRLAAQWRSTLDRLQVHTPDEHVDRMVNTWNPYQCAVTFNLSRSASMFEVGIGRGMGFRDSCQDLLGYVHLAPERASERLLDLAATQLPDGGAYHQYQPLTKRGNDAIGSGFNDDPLWLVLATSAYVKETGDRGILDVLAPYDGVPATATPMLDHLRRAVGFTLEHLGPHGLPLIGRADWNDCLNLNCFSDTPGESFQTTENRPGGVAESVFIAGLFVLAADALAELDVERADEHRAAARAMRDAVRVHGWDGDWFLRAFAHDGEPIGSAVNDEGRIYVEPQGICVMAGIGLDDDTAARALDAVAEHLVTPHGIQLLEPPYATYHRELGEISSYPPGYKENGSVFCHTNPWIVIAETMIGRGDRALEHHLRVNPSAREAISDVHRSEPYVYAQTIAGRAAATFGEAKNSWLTGTASWSLVSVTQWLLGIRPEHDGLRVDPCLPASWPGFTARRHFRGATYDLRVHKEVGTVGRVRSLVVDGAPVPGTVVPVAPAGAVVVVEAEIA